MRPARLSATAVLVLLLAAAAPGCSTAQKVESFAVDEPVTRIVLDVDNGDTTVVGTEARSVSVRRTVHQRRGKPQLTRRVTAGVLTLRSRCPSGFLGSCSVEHRVSAPSHTDIEVHARSGSVRVERLQSAVTVTTGSGAVTLTRPGGRVMVRTGSGKLALDQASDDLDLQTGSGSITADRLASPHAVVRTGSASVRLDFTAAPDSLDVTSGSGTVEATLPKDAYQVDTSTTSGTVTVKGLRKERTGRHLKATTVSGDITIKGQ
jgi:hypothetical protein